MNRSDTRVRPSDLGASYPQTHSFGVCLRFRPGAEVRQPSDLDSREAFWRGFVELTKGSFGEDWRIQARPGLLEAAFEREVSAALGEQFSRRFLGRGPYKRHPGDPGEEAPAAFYTLVKKVGFRCRVTGYSSLNVKMTVSGFQSLMEIFDRDFESFRVFFEPFLYRSLASAYNGHLASSLSAELRFPDAFKTDFETPPPPPASTRSRWDAHARADWLWRLANGSLLIPVLLALAVLVFAGMAVRDLHRTYVDGVSRLLDLTVQHAADTRSPPDASPSADTAAEPADTP